MGSFGCALAYGPTNDIGVTGLGFTLGDLADDLYASLLRHPAYPELFDREPDRGVHDADDAIDAFLSTHDALEALHGRDTDPYIAGPIVDVADRARMVAGMTAMGPRGIRPRASERRCVVVLVTASAVTGTAITCGRGPRLSFAFADAIGNLQDHPLLPAFAEHRPPSLDELEAFEAWRDPVIANLVQETEVDP